MLMSAGANVSLTAHNGCTAFDIASLIGDTELVHLLAAASMRPSSRHSSTSRDVGGGDKQNGAAVTGIYFVSLLLHKLSSFSGSDILFFCDVFSVLIST